MTIFAIKQFSARSEIINFNPRQMKNYFFIILLFISCAAIAQDTIVKKNGDIIQAKISEIGTEEIKFKVFSAPDGPTIILKKLEVKKIRVAGQTVLEEKEEPAAPGTEDIIVKKSGETLKVKVMEIGTEEVKFKLSSSPDGPSISILKSDIKTMKVDGQTVIDVKTGLTEDIITKRDGSVIKAKIIEMGTDDVKYKLYSNPDGPVLSLKKSKEVKSVVIDGQTVYEYKEDPLTISNNAIVNRTSAVKFHFFSPLNHHMAFDYEWMNKPGFNWEVGFGIIGPGVSSNDKKKPRGAFLRGGPKFLLGNSSDIEVEGGRLAHPLKGKYIKVEMILNTFSTTNYIDTTTYTYNPNPVPGGMLMYKKQYQSVTLDLQYGRQYIFGNAMTLSWYIGVGYSFESKTSTLPPKYSNPFYDFDLKRYSHSYMGVRFPLAFTSGITIGYILPAPKDMKGKSKPPTRHSMTEKK